MAITPIAFCAAAKSTSTSTTSNFFSSAFTDIASGSSGYSPVAGDLIVAFVTHSGTAARTQAQLQCSLDNTGNMTAVNAVYTQSDTAYISTQLWYAWVSTSDTKVTSPGVQTAGSTSMTVIYIVFRGVDPTTPFGGVSVVQDNQFNGTKPNLGAITTPASPTGAVIVGFAGQAQAAATAVALVSPTSAAFDATTRYTGTNLQNATTNSASSIYGIKTGVAVSTAFDPGVYTGGVSTSTASAAAQMFVLIPQIVSTSLTVQDAVSASLADNVALSPKTALTVQGAVAAALADNVTLSPKTALTVQAAVGASLADNVTVTAHGPTLTMQAAVSASLADNITLAPKTALTVQAAVSASLAGNVVLAPHTALTVQSAVGAALADNVTLTAHGPTLTVQGAVTITIPSGGSVDTGTNLLTNGDFASSTGWTLGAGWTISGGTLNAANATGLANFNGLVPSSRSKKYQIGFDLNAYAGSGIIQMAFGNVSGISASSTGTKRATITASSNIDPVVLAADSTVTTATIDNMVVYDSDSIALTLHPALAMQSAVSASLADNVVITPRTALTVQAAVSAGLAGNVVLAPRTALTVQAAVSAGLAGNVTLSPHTALTVQSAVSAALADNVTLANLHYVLTVQSAVSAGLADNVTISTHGGLGVQAAVSASLADNVTLAPKTVLTVQGAVGAALADNVTITFHANQIAVQNAVAAALADNVTLASHYALTVQNAVAAALADNVLLAPKTALTVANAISAGLAANVTLASHYALTVQNAVAAALADNVTLVLHSIGLTVQNAISATLADNVALSAPHYALTVQNAIAPALADNVSLVFHVGLTVQGAVSASLTTSPTLAAWRTIVTWATKDPVTGSYQTSNPGTQVLQGYYVTVTKIPA